MRFAEIVPSELLVPPDAHSRGLHHDDAALVLDGWLRRLASQETRCRQLLGQLGAAFLRHRGHHQLGFSRVSDYTRERLGISGRELRSLATAMTRLEGLPALGGAFEKGLLSWTQVRLLTTVATPETEAEWLALARGRTVRALEALIREAGRLPDPEAEDEPSMYFRMRCPRRLLRLWREVVELARRMAGTHLTQGQAAEAIAAEGLSARPAAEEAWPEPLWSTAASPPDPGETRCAFASEIDWSAVAEALPEDVVALGLDVGDCDAFVLDSRMRRLVAAMQHIDWQMGRLLRVFLDRRLHRVMRFSCAARYLRERLGISARKARALVALERKTWEAPDLGEAYRSGALSWVRALAMLPVVHEQTVAAWVARGRAVTVRRLIDEVEWALAVRDGYEPIAPPALGASLDAGQRQMRAREEWEPGDAEIGFAAPVSVVAVFRTAVLTYADPGDALWSGFEKLLRHVRAEWAGQPRHRDPIFARDGWICATPACTSRRNLHDHHLLFRSRGGDNGRENRITVCAWHHLRGIHGGRVRAWGEAPDGVSWELGVRAGRTPLLRLRGDVYAS
jgi:hypothetical protein